MNVDPFELFGEEWMTPTRKGDVIAQLQQLPVSAAIKRTVYARWCDIVNVPKSELDFRAVQRRVES